MSAPMTREEAISLRTTELLADNHAVAEIFERIQKHGGLALLSGMRQWLLGETVFIRERGADQAANVIGAFAWLQASNEYAAKPLVREG